MCMMSGGPSSYRSKPKLSATNIFCRRMHDGTQALVYGMNIQAEDPLAMVLPLPLVPGATEDAVRFVDMSYPQFFVELNAGFPAVTVHLPPARGGGGGASAQTVRPRLKVHKSGDFVASFVPGIADFDRLDPRFRLAPAVWDKLPTYSDWGFAVFTLADVAKKGFFARLLGIGRRTIRPMSLTFPSRFDALFFPTVHVHDGEVHPVADFDHFLYWQAAEKSEMKQDRVPPSRELPPSGEARPDALPRYPVEFGDYSRVTDARAETFLDLTRASGLVDGADVVRRRRVVGKIRNEDHWLIP